MIALLSKTVARLLNERMLLHFFIKKLALSVFNLLNAALSLFKAALKILFIDEPNSASTHGDACAANDQCHERIFYIHISDLHLQWCLNE